MLIYKLEGISLLQINTTTEIPWKHRMHLRHENSRLGFTESVHEEKCIMQHSSRSLASIWTELHFHRYEWTLQSQKISKNDNTVYKYYLLWKESCTASFSPCIDNTIMCKLFTPIDDMHTSCSLLCINHIIICKLLTPKGDRWHHTFCSLFRSCFLAASSSSDIPLELATRSIISCHKLIISCKMLPVRTNV